MLILQLMPCTIQTSAHLGSICYLGRVYRYCRRYWSGIRVVVASSGGGGGHPGLALGEHDKSIEEAEAVLGGGGEVTADSAELAGAGHGAQAAGYLLLQLGHPDVALSSVVIRWRAEIRGKPQVIVLPVEQAAGQRVVLLHQRPGAGSGLAGPDQDGGAEQADLDGQRGRVHGAPSL